MDVVTVTADAMDVVTATAVATAVATAAGMATGKFYATSGGWEGGGVGVAMTVADN